MKTLLRSEFGSHLYGTSLPTSDRDYKEVYLPSLEHLLLGKSLTNKLVQTSGNKNTKDDVDTEYVSVHTFVKDFVQGQTYALELAFCPAVTNAFKEGTFTQAFESVTYMVDSRFLQFVAELRSTCLTREVTEMVGYCLGQARKYSAKGERLNAVVALQEHLAMLSRNRAVVSPEQRLESFRQGLEAFLKVKGKEHTKYLKFETDNEGREFLVVLEKKMNLHLGMIEVFDRLEVLKEQFGERAKKAADFDGADWKALMHSCRVAFEAKQLLTEHKLVLPFTGEQREYLLAVRQGQVPFDDVMTTLNKLVDEVRELQDKCTLPLRSEVEEKAQKLLLEFLKQEYGV